MSTAPVSSHSTTPVSSQPATPISSQSTAPVSSQSTAPVPKQSTATSACGHLTCASPKPASYAVPNSSEPDSSESDSSESDSTESEPTESEPSESSESSDSGLGQHHQGDPVCLRGADSYRNLDNSTAALSTERHPNDTDTYEILEKGSTQGNPLLVSSDGYDFYLERSVGLIKRWVCNNRSCLAAVNQRGDCYRPAQREHTHPPQPYIKIKRQMIAEAKEMAISDINRSADSIAKEICSRAPKEVLNVLPIYKLKQMVKYATRRKDLKTRGKN